MIHTQHLLKVTAAWVSIVYVICFIGIAMMPGIRPGFMMYGLHMQGPMVQNMLSVGTFFSGIIIWNVVAFLAVGLFAVLYNAMKK